MEATDGWNMGYDSQTRDSIFYSLVNMNET